MGRTRKGAALRFILVLVWVTGCRTAPTLPTGVEWVTSSADPLQWSGRDIIPLVTPIRPPTSVDRTARIVVALTLPGSATLTTATDVHGRDTMMMPLGTVATRIEFLGSTDPDAEPAANWRVLDVRQFEWRAAGLDCVVLRPASGALAGVRWRCGRDGDAAAGQVLATLMRDCRLDGPADDAGREQAGAHLRQLNGCSTCHEKDRAEERTPAALVQRATDAQGLFSLRSLFTDEGAVERYRPVDPNAADRLMEPRCPGSELDLVAARCADGRRAVLRLDVARGRRERSLHVERLCASRRAVASHLDAAGRAALAQPLEECQ